MDSDQIDQYYRDVPSYGGCVYKGELNRVITPGHFYIVNLDKVGGGGTHWVLLSLVGSVPVYFDSMGFPCDRVVRGAVKTPLTYNPVEIQPVDSDLCGYYCVDAMDKMLNGQSLDTIVSGYAHTPGKLKRNDRTVKKSVKRTVVVGNGSPISLFA